ncbi:MAG: hypothetical protein HW380_832 [Magnetococcales bacterium]|nr:hypothetical protein [Magnetococcales bacterium]
MPIEKDVKKILENMREDEPRIFVAVVFSFDSGTFAYYAPSEEWDLDYISQSSAAVQGAAEKFCQKLVGAKPGLLEMKTAQGWIVLKNINDKYGLLGLAQEGARLAVIHHTMDEAVMELGKILK